MLLGVPVYWWMQRASVVKLGEASEANSAEVKLTQ